MKRILSIFICLIIVIGILPTAAFASEQIEMETPEHFESYGSVERLESLVDIDSFRDYLFDSFYQCEEVIDISSYMISNTTNNKNALKEFIWKEMPECFHVYGIGWYISGNSLVKIAVTYDFTAAEYQKMYTELVAAKDKLLKGIKDNNNITDVQKALLIHDRLALICEYDNDLGTPETMYGSYGALVMGLAVCEGYAHAYQYLLNEIGIENYFCSSAALNHAWNIIYINSNPYHVDVTWDDSYLWTDDNSGVVGRVSHDNFLRSTNGIQATGHNATDFDSFPVDTTYDDYFWQTSQTAFQLVDNELYYIDNEAEALKRYSDKKVLCDVSDEWSNQNYLFENCANLSSDGNLLLYSLTDAIYKYDIETKTSTIVFEPELSPYYSIYGFKYEDNYITCDISNAVFNYPYAYDLYQIHEYLDFVTHDYQPSYDESGHFDECTICGDIINISSHLFDNNCDTDCGGCDYVRQAQHSWSEWICNDAATEETRTCTSCGETQVNILSDDPTYRPDRHMPFVTLNSSENAVVLDQNKSWATRVYWGCIGDEYVDYKWFDEDFRLLCGTDYFADYTPRQDEVYNFTKTGWYRFIVKAIRTGTTTEDYTYSELLFDFYYDGTNPPTVPTVTELGNNQVKINTNSTSIKKFYYGNIGDNNVPYSWFNSFWGAALGTKTYTPVFDSRDERIITLQTKGYYNIVIVGEDNTEYVYTVYTDTNAPVIKNVDNKAVVDIDILKGNVGTNATINKIYYGYVGTEDKQLDTYNEIKANTTGFTADASAVQGKAYTLKNKGYYKFLVVTVLSNSKTVELVYTIENN